MDDHASDLLRTDVLNDLRQLVRGPVIMPEEPAYDSIRSIWNGMIDRRPAAIVRCIGTSDVITCINLARDRGIPISVRGGGHNIAGLSLCDDALLIDLSLMRGVWVDPQARIAHAQGGCTLGDVDRETQIHGLAAVLGFISNTGIAGLTLGGGFGYLSRKYGWTTDNLRSVRLVTATGELVTASESENSDLFWGIRGGGGNFGVVTDFEYQLYPVGPEIVGGAIAWSLEDGREVLDLYGRIAESAPPEMTSAVVIRNAPPAPWINPEYHGKPVVIWVTCHTGSLDDAERDVAAIKSFGNPVGDVIQRRPYVVQQSLLDATAPNGRHYYWKSEYTAQVTPELLDRLMKHAGTAPSPHTGLFLFALDGAINQLPEDHSAVGNRDAGFVINIASGWDDPAADVENVAWTREVWEDLREFSTGGTYINFLTEEEGEQRIRNAYGANFDRLVEIKRKWDPENLFCQNKNIVP